MFKKLILSLAFIAMLIPPTMAQFIPKLEEVDARDKQVMAGLYSTVSNPTFIAIRGGGATGKPLGQYLVEPNVVFKSDYKGLPIELQVKFAYDLHEHLKAAGRDWPAMQRNTQLNYEPYDKQREFAEFYFRRNYEPFKSMGIFFIDGFLNDALIDATNIYNYFYRQGHSSANYIIWEDAALQQIVKKK